MSDRQYASVVSRRTFLLVTGLGSSGLVPGCLGREGEETTLQLRTPDQSTKGIATLSADLRPDQITLIEDAVANDTATANGYHPFETIEYVRHAGTYYHLQTEEVGTEIVETTVLVVAPTEDSSEAVPLDEYDGHAIELIAPLIGDDEPQTRPLYPDMSGFRDLYPEPKYETITWEENTYRVSIETRQLEQQVHRILVEPVAPSPNAFEAYLRENRIDVQLDPDDFSQTARDIFRRAIENKYQENEPYSDSFQTVLGAIQEGMPINNPDDGLWLVVYDDSLFRAQITRIIHEP